MPIKLKVILAMTFIFAATSGCGRGGPEGPVAAIKPHEMTIHGDTRVDNYYWLNDRENPEVIAYLEAENEYLTQVMGHTDDFQDDLFEEMKGRIKKDDASAPYEWNGFWYYTRYEPDGEYALHCRRPGTMTGPEEVMLDGNAMGEGLSYFSLRGVDVSPDAKLVVYGVDDVGRRRYTLRVKNLETGQTLPDAIPAVTGNVAWAMDNRTLFYGKQDPETLRSYQIWRHVLGTDPAEDVLVYEEKDDTFNCYVDRSKSDKYLIIASSQTLSNEYRILEADNPLGEFRVFQPRQRDLEYSVDHQGDRFLVLTNLHARNFRLMECPEDKTWLASWQEVIPHREEVMLEDVEVFADFLVVAERHGGLRHLRVMDLQSGASHELDFGEATWSVYGAANPNMDTTLLRYGYSSLTTPSSTFGYDMKTRQKFLVKQQEILGGFDAANYQAEYLQVPARDGAMVPVSLVYRKGFTPDGTSPCSFTPTDPTV